MSGTPEHVDPASAISEPALFTERGPCPLCGGTDYDVVHDFDQIPVRRCRNCGFMHSAKVMSPEGVKRYYTSEFGSERHRDGQIVNAEVNIRALAKLLDLKQVQSFLDVGTGYGFLLKQMHERYGIRGVGVELSYKEAEFGVKSLGADIRPVALRDSNLPRNSFDLVGSFEVIEHVPNPRPFVEELAEYCKPGGYIAINTDNFESDAVKKLGAEFRKWIPHSHVSHFGPATLRRCVEAVPGLRVVKELSFTPWENVAQAALLMREPRPAPEAFRMEAFMKTEMSRGYKLFALRKAMNKLWFSLRYRKDLSGAMMFVLVRKS